MNKIKSREDNNIYSAKYITRCRVVDSNLIIIACDILRRMLQRRNDDSYLP